MNEIFRKLKMANGLIINQPNMVCNPIKLLHIYTILWVYVLGVGILPGKRQHST